jgi:hypothetical protein
MAADQCDAGYQVRHRFSSAQLGHDFPLDTAYRLRARHG